MANKFISVLLSLQDKFSAPMKKAAQSTKDAERSMRTAQNSIKKLATGANSGFLSMTKAAAGFGAKLAGLAGIGGIAGTVASIKSLSAQSVELANAQIKAETELDAMLKNVKSIAKGGDAALRNASTRLKSYAGDLQSVGVIGDEVTISGMAQLASFQMNEAQIKKVSAGMLDLLAKNKGLNATQEDAVNVANMIGKAMSGNASSMSRVGIIMSDYQQKVIKYGNANQRAAMIAKVLEENVGGMNKALAQTDEGKAQQARNAYGDMLEEFGKNLLPIRAQLWSTFGETLPTIQATVLPLLARMQGAFTSAMPAIKNAIEGAVQKLPAIVDAIGSAFETYYPIVKKAFGFLIEHSNVLIGVFATFAAYNIAAKIAGIIAPAVRLVGVMRNAGGVLKVIGIALKANPLGMFAIAVGVLAGAFISCYKNSEEFRARVDALLEKLKVVGAWFVDVFPTVCSEGFGLVSDIFSGLAPFFEGIVDNLLIIINGLVDVITGVFTGNWRKAWDGLGDIVKGIFKGIAQGFLDLVSGFTDSIKNVGKRAAGWFGFGDSNGGTTTHNALGTSYFSGGLTHINERNRGELITLPSGSQIIPHDLSKRLLQGGGRSVVVNLNVQGNVIGNEDFLNECGEHISRRVRIALANC